MRLDERELQAAQTHFSNRQWALCRDAYARALGLPGGVARATSNDLREQGPSDEGQAVDRSGRASVPTATETPLPEQRLDALSPADQLRRNLAANLAELAEFRPKLLQQIEAAPHDARFSVDVTASGRPTIRFTPPEGPSRRLTQGDDPLQYLALIMQQISAARHKGQPLILLGVADGYLLTALARHPVPLPLGKEQCVYVVEPHIGNLLVTMMLHDWTGDAGPIRQSRFYFFVGSDAMARFEAALVADPFLPFPEINLASAPVGPMLARSLPEILDRLVQRDRAKAAEVARRYAVCDLATLVAVTGERPPRSPRALLLTTRLSTVLQYATADAAAALRELGWEVEVVIEPTTHHVLTFPALRQRLLDHRPDVILQIDHVRSEHGELFPATIPFLCWTQDHLPNLTSRQAGRSQGKLDFLLTNHGPWYTREFDYPADRHIALGKLTRMPELPESWAEDGPDLCYVSNAARSPQTAADDLERAYACVSATLAGLVKPCVERLEAMYRAGESIAGTVAMRQLVASVAGERGVVLQEAELASLATELFERVNNLLYRQQALTWVADVADRHGLRLAIYGSGWTGHPRFGRYAKGPVRYGEPLERLTRSARINLQIVPYSCLHQRLLDGIAAGGFYLVRSHPSDTSIARLAGFLERHAPHARDLAAAVDATAPEHRAELERLAGDNAFIADRLDPVELVRVYTDQGLFAGGRLMPPHIDEVSFDSPESLERLVHHFLARPDARRQIVARQREAVAETLSYTAGMRRVVRRLNELLARQLAGDDAGDVEGRGGGGVEVAGGALGDSRAA